MVVFSFGRVNGNTLPPAPFRALRPVTTCQYAGRKHKGTVR
jgi:hypothetical protein